MFMCALTALQTILKHVSFEKKHSTYIPLEWESEWVTEAILWWAIQRFELYLLWQQWQFGAIEKSGTSLSQLQLYNKQSAWHTHSILLVSTVWRTTAKLLSFLHFFVYCLWKFTTRDWKDIGWVNFWGILLSNFDIMPHQNCAPFLYKRIHGAFF